MTIATTPSHAFYKRDFSGGGSAGVGILVAIVLGVLGFLLLRWHRKRTQYQISSRDQAVRVRLNAWKKDATPQQGSKRLPDYVEATGWRSGERAEVAREAAGGARAALNDGGAGGLPGYGEATGGGRAGGEVVEMQMPGEAHVR